MPEVSQALSKQQSQETPLRLQEGGVYRGKVVERLSDREAVVNIRGNKQRVRFEGSLPKENNVTLEIIGKKDGVMTAREVARPVSNGESNGHTQRHDYLREAFKQANIERPSEALLKAVRELQNARISITKETVEQLHRFMSHGKGSGEEKLHTVRAAAIKQVSITETNLRHIHESLHHHRISDTLNEAKGQHTPIIDERMNRAVRQAISEVRETSQVSQRSQALIDAIRSIRKDLQNGANVEDVKARLQTEVMNHSQLKESEAKMIRQAIKEADVLHETGRNRLDRALAEVSREIRGEGSRANAARQTEGAPGTETVPRTSNGSTRSLSETIQSIRQDLSRGAPISEVRDRIQRELLRHPEVSSREASELRRVLRESPPSTPSSRAHLERVLSEISRDNRHPHPSTPRLDGNSSRVVESASVRADGSTRSLSDTIQSIRQDLSRGAPISEVRDRIQRELLRHPEVSSRETSQLRNILRHTSSLDASSRVRLDQALQQLRGEMQSRSSISTSAITTIVQEALTNRGSTDLITKLIKQGVSEAQAQKLHTLVKQALQLDQVASERLLQTLARIESATGLADTNGQLQKIVMSLQSAVKKDPNFSQVIERVKEELLSQLPEKVKKEATEQMQRIEMLLKEGKELQAREQTYRMLENYTNTTRSQPVVAATYAENELRHTNVPFETKQLLETRITERLYNVQSDFKQLQDQTVRQLEQAERMLEQRQRPDARQVIEGAIKQLDRAILRSEAMLFTDMKTEKQLLQASGQLAHAKKLLQQGQLQEAKQILHQVRQTVEKLTFQPSEQKVKQFVLEEEPPIARHKSALTQMANRVADYGRQITTEPSARLVFELIRTLGLNRDSEVAQMLTQGTKGDGPQTSVQTVKDSLLQLLKEDAKTNQQANQTLSHLSGQQLLSKSEAGTNMQHLYFHLPLPLKEKLEDIEVYVQARENGEMLDWENCTLYFKLNTPRLGETGIVIQAKDRQLSVTLKNDQKDFSLKMQPLVEKTVASISELGYQLHDIHYTTLTTDTVDRESQREETEEFIPFYTEEGFDYKI